MVTHFTQIVIEGITAAKKAAPKKEAVAANTEEARSKVKKSPKAKKKILKNNNNIKLIMAHKKGVGSSKNGRESESKRLGVKILRTSCY
jgi:hypothetical protein